MFVELPFGTSVNEVFSLERSHSLISLELAETRVPKGTTAFSEAFEGIVLFLKVPVSEFELVFIF